MPIFWLSPHDHAFPDPALADPRGLLALGGDLSPDRLLQAYARGIFPWYSEGDPLMWWSPDPRFVLFPDELRVARSMRPYFNQRKFGVSCDRDFRAVITACQVNVRPGQPGGTWITEDMLEAYCKLHDLGYAHSVEVWQDEKIVAGLYGVALGNVFFGESMFTSVSNGSKFGFISLVRRLRDQGYWLIDCQQPTGHLESLGARNLDRKLFLDTLEKNRHQTTRRGSWQGLFENEN